MSTQIASRDACNSREPSNIVDADYSRNASKSRDVINSRGARNSMQSNNSTDVCYRTPEPAETQTTAGTSWTPTPGTPAAAEISGTS
jgi:hypothetical protein